MSIMSEDFDRLHWPFRARFYDEIGWVYHMCLAERRAAVRRMTDREQLRAALSVPGLQKGVEQAIHKRLRKLGEG